MNFKKSLAPAELEAILSPQLRLFLSVDVVGSTAFKHRKSQQGESKPWLKFIHGFYTGFPDICRKKVVEVETGAGTKAALTRPYLWKALGDELIFSVLLRHPSHVRLYLKAFQLSLQEAIRQWAGGEQPLPISFKGTAWLAGFPVFNSAVPLETDEPLSPESEHFDFVGPLIDIGFRLSKFASPRKFVISADIAWLITTLGDTAGMQFHYDGREPLKGVLHDKPYPIFWIDCHEEGNGHNQFDAIEDKVLKREPVPFQSISNLSGAFLDSVADSIPKPFFCGDDISPQFQRPEKFEARLEDAQREIQKIYGVTYADAEDGATSQDATVEADDLLKAIKKAAPRSKRASSKKPASVPGKQS